MNAVALLKPSSSVAEQRHSATRGSNTQGVNCLIGLVLLGFGVAHVIGATILMRGEQSLRSPGAMVAVHTD